MASVLFAAIRMVDHPWPEDAQGGLALCVSDDPSWQFGYSLTVKFNHV
jgi:hypothetical protein